MPSFAQGRQRLVHRPHSSSGKVASDYPPVAKILAERLTKEDHDPSKIYTFYDELLEEEHQDVVRELDELVLQRAHA